MNEKGLTGNYDHFVLAGSSLGLSAKTNPIIESWQSTWNNHLDIAIRFHSISKVIIIDHEDCGAYKEFLGFNNRDEDIAMPNIIPAKELDIHSKYLRAAYRQIRTSRPELKVELYMIGLQDNVVRISPHNQQESSRKDEKMDLVESRESKAPNCGCRRS